MARVNRDASWWNTESYPEDAGFVIKPRVEVSSNVDRIGIMKFGGLTDGAGQLKMAADKLQEAWDAAQGDWHDVVSRTMEEEQLKPLMDQLRATLDAITRTGVVLATAVRECDDERG